MKIKEGYCFDKTSVKKLESINFVDTTSECGLVNIFPLEKSEIVGFGGAFTESAAYNYSIADAKAKREILEWLFGEEGLNYNFCRVCMGSSDFALDEYCYVDENDLTLETFNIEKDKLYIIPFIKAAIEYSKQKIEILASPWSPPAFMKENNTRFKGGKLKKEYYELYADYIIKFLEAYENEGIKISALSIQNEPKAIQTWESCFFTAEDEAELALNLKKKLIQKNYDVNILCWDHNKERLFERADKIYSMANSAVDGAGFHWYSGEYFGSISAIKAKYPNKLALATEFCISEYEDKTESKYAEEILGDIDHGADGIIEWNLILNENGGPFHNRRGGCDAPIRVFPDTKNAERSNIYYETYMFSHFIKRGAKSLYTASFSGNVKVCAVKNPNGELVVNVLNKGQDTKAEIFIDGKGAAVTLNKDCLYTFIIE